MQNETAETQNMLERAKLERELSEARERHLRLAADFDNFRKRTARELERRSASQKEALVRDLLPVIDNLERALAARDGHNFKEGVEMIHKQVLDILKKHGFEPREDLGQMFDQRFHDAIATRCNPAVPDQAVLEVWERGWMRGTEMFRPAKVLVNKVEQESPASSDVESPLSMTEFSVGAR